MKRRHAAGEVMPPVVASRLPAHSSLFRGDSCDVLAAKLQHSCWRRQPVGFTRTAAGRKSIATSIATAFTSSALNDTHNCRLRAFVRNGVLTRIEQNYDAGRYADQLGNTASVHWNPRGCPKGYTLTRRIYGPYRLKQPLLRAGWKRWADDGFPELTAANRDEYKFTTRGTDTFEPVTWTRRSPIWPRERSTSPRPTAAQTARSAQAEGYQPEMIEEMGGAGT
jgi:hypothetical protein